MFIEDLANSDSSKSVLRRIIRKRKGKKKKEKEKSQQAMRN